MFNNVHVHSCIWVRVHFSHTSRVALFSSEGVLPSQISKEDKVYLALSLTSFDFAIWGFDCMWNVKHK